MARIDATELLRNQHREAQAVFALFDQTKDEDTRREMAAALVKALSIHAAIEELVFYPALRDRVPDGESLITRSLQEHQELKELLVQLDRATIRNNADLPGLMAQLRTAVVSHVTEEEEETFPAARQALAPEELADLGERLTREASRAPTKPHPHAPATPPANRIADAAAAVLDKTRDALTRRR